MRTRDKSFNATIRTNFDTRLTKLILDPQSIGRVLLNLINNALYSLNEKRKKSGEDYEPILTVSTRRIPPGSEGWPTLEIKISDNGIGVAGPILGKIFQPFFTTKGPGQGTGLGLSLAYDIVNKEHGGQIDVDTHEGEYAEFIIRIPLKENLK
jgi:signal transduction histidine kinase